MNPTSLKFILFLWHMKCLILLGSRIRNFFSRSKFPIFKIILKFFTFNRPNCKSWHLINLYIKCLWRTDLYRSERKKYQERLDGKWFDSYTSSPVKEIVGFWFFKRFWVSLLNFWKSLKFFKNWIYSTVFQILTCIHNLNFFIKAVF